MALRIRIRVGFLSEFIPPLKYLDKLRFHFHFEFEVFENKSMGMDLNNGSLHLEDCQVLTEQSKVLSNLRM